METDAHRAGVHVAATNDQLGVDAQLFGFGNLGFDRVGAKIGFAPDEIGAK